jgi:transmembrane protein TMEM174 (potassium channel)
MGGVNCRASPADAGLASSHDEGAAKPELSGGIALTADERTLHRLEAFSDIVIGFCLAEAGLSLVIPKSVAELATMWTSLNALAFSFVLVSMLWWYHHRLFVTYLTLNAATVVMNFALLAALVFGVYFQQVTIHFLAGGIDPGVPLRLWLGSMALIYVLLAAMYAIGILERRRALDAPAVLWGVSLTYQTAISALGLAALCVTSPFNLKSAGVIVLIVGLAAALRGPAVSRLTGYLNG